MGDTIRLKLKVWRQEGPKAPGRFETYDLDGISEHISFLEMLDMLNQRLITEGKTPITFEHDCREGICGSCGFAINGQPPMDPIPAPPCVSSICGPSRTVRPWCSSRGAPGRSRS